MDNSLWIPAKMTINKRSIAIILLYALVFSIFANASLYLVSKQLFAFRLVLPVCLLTLIAMNIKVHKRLSLFVQIFFIYTIYTLFLTLVHPSYANAGDIINFILLFFYVYVLILFLSEYTAEFQKALANLCVCFIIFYLGFAFYEIFTGNHFPESVLNEFEDIRTNVPSVVYVNQNDFCTVLTLMTCYCFVYFKGKKATIFLSVLLIPIIIVTFIAGARLNIVLMGAFLGVLIMTSIRSAKGVVSLGIAFMLVSGLGLYLGDMAFDMDDYNFEDESTSIRISLYKHALNSIVQSGGLGFGVNTGQEYYKEINDPSLQWIIDPHSYLFEILINSGLIFFFIYIIASIWIVFRFLSIRKYVLAAFYVIYFFVLFSSSSSIFLMAHYLFFCYIIYEATGKAPKAKLTPR